jgi:type I restriction-modification system DNA methylase subunit
LQADLGELEDRLWDAADELRANSGLRASEYSAPMLGLIFLRFADAQFEAARAAIEAKASARPQDRPHRLSRPGADLSSSRISMWNPAAVSELVMARSGRCQKRICTA